MTHVFTQSAAEEFRKMDKSTPLQKLLNPNPHRQDAEPPFSLCERTVRACAEQARRCYPGTYDGGYGAGFNQGVAAAAKSVESLLPKPDRAKELVDWFRDLPDQYGVELDRPVLERFARALITEKGAKL